jgi:hypothetical protein
MQWRIGVEERNVTETEFNDELSRVRQSMRILLGDFGRSHALRPGVQA